MNFTSSGSVTVVDGDVFDGTVTGNEGQGDGRCETETITNEMETLDGCVTVKHSEPRVQIWDFCPGNIIGETPNKSLGGPPN